VIGNLGRRAIELVVLLFALLGFAFVPLGSRTGLGHVRAILETGAAGQAGRGLIEALGRLRQSFGTTDPAPGSAAISAARPIDRASTDAGAVDASVRWP
jgi:hypothetical protein